MEPYYDEETGKLVRETSGKRNSQKKNNFKLYKVIVPLALVGSVSIIVVSGITRSNRLKRENSIQKYNNDKYNNMSFEQTVGDNQVTYLITDKEMAEYEKFKQLLKYKESFKNVNLGDGDIYDIAYDDITIELMENVIGTYFTELDNKSPEYYEACRTMKSIFSAVEKYDEEKGRKMVEEMAAKVLIEKVVMSNKLSIGKVDAVTLKYCNGNLLKVEFDYIDNGRKISYVSDKFKNQGNDYVENLGDDLKNDRLEAIYDINALAVDNDYEVGIKIK